MSYRARLEAFRAQSQRAAADEGARVHGYLRRSEVARRRGRGTGAFEAGQAVLAARDAARAGLDALALGAALAAYVAHGGPGGACLSCGGSGRVGTDEWPGGSDCPDCWGRRVADCYGR